MDRRTTLHESWVSENLAKVMNTETIKLPAVAA